MTKPIEATKILGATLGWDFRVGVERGWMRRCERCGEELWHYGYLPRRVEEITHPEQKYTESGWPLDAEGKLMEISGETDQ